MKDYLDVWGDANATELELLPLLAATLSPSSCNLTSFGDKLKENARKFLRKKLAEMELDNEDMIVETPNSIQAKPAETLDLMDRFDQ